VIFDALIATEKIATVKNQTGTVDFFNKKKRAKC